MYLDHVHSKLLFLVSTILVLPNFMTFLLK